MNGTQETNAYFDQHKGCIQLIQFVKVAALFFFVITGSLVHAQLLTGFDLASPIGLWPNSEGQGLGFTVGYDGNRKGHFTWTASSSLFTYSGNAAQQAMFQSRGVSRLFGGGVTYLLCAGGVKYYFNNASRLYATADLGIYFLGKYGTRIGPSLGFGYRLSNYDFSFRCNLAPDFNYLSVRAVYFLARRS